MKTLSTNPPGFGDSLLCWDVDSWVWISGLRSMGLDSCVWIPGFGFMTMILDTGVRTVGKPYPRIHLDSGIAYCVRMRIRGFGFPAWIYGF